MKLLRSLCIAGLAMFMAMPAYSMSRRPQENARMALENYLLLPANGMSEKEYANWYDNVVDLINQLSGTAKDNYQTRLNVIVAERPVEGPSRVLFNEGREALDELLSQDIAKMNTTQYRIWNASVDAMLGQMHSSVSPRTKKQYEERAINKRNERK